MAFLYGDYDCNIQEFTEFMDRLSERLPTTARPMAPVFPNSNCRPGRRVLVLTIAGD
ncbi:hypothetical protein Thiowin_04353 [Thiorhodovibrio winogradskyi]|uniref:Uncharacterized protein n=1 Tax=Thiorhodovibrio winogradskyi TaxID=77007 RepID=A0ABZ0SGQ9_9GAMM|nr:hypothetical protein [Thiorhodovibrio winogradskyi]